MTINQASPYNKKKETEWQKGHTQLNSYLFINSTQQQKKKRYNEKRSLMPAK